MPTSAVAVATNFNDAYSKVGVYITDDSRIPYFNPANSGVDILPGEPFVMQWGASGEEIVVMAQDIIRPGKIGMVIRYFTADLPCDFSANVILGTDVYWDIDANVVSLVGDVTNGFVVGRISYSLSSKGSVPAVDSNGRVICGTTSTTKCRVVSVVGATTVKGTVVNL